MRKIIPVNVADRGEYSVEVQPGITWKQLEEELAEIEASRQHDSNARVYAKADAWDDAVSDSAHDAKDATIGRAVRFARDARIFDEWKIF